MKTTFPTILLTATALAVAPTTTATATVADAGSIQTKTALRRMEEDMTTMSGGATPQQCIIETGFDYTGEDLANQPSATAENCCNLCATTTGCKAFTWTPYNKGTCWLKRARGKIVVNAAASSAIVTPGPRMYSDLKQDTDIVGNDIGSRANMGSADACAAYCRSNNKPGCRAFSWVPANGGTCYFKSGRGESVVKAGVASADVYPPFDYESSQFNAKQVGVDYAVGDLASKPSRSADGCFQLCRETEGCNAFTWTDFNGGTCWLKYGPANPVTKAGAISGVVDQVPVGNIDFVINTDIKGNDIGNSRDAMALRCVYKCINFVDGCKAVTWSQYNGRTCWYKGASGPLVDAAEASTMTCVL